MQTYVGATQKLCVQGRSSQTNANWRKAEVQIPPVSIPHTGCSTCGCLVDTNLNLSLGASPTEPRYSAFEVFAPEVNCSGVLDFVSLLVIKNATSSDRGNYVFSIGRSAFPSTRTFVVREPSKSKTQNVSIS